jgi:adenylate cyclase
LLDAGRDREANREIELALRLDSRSYEVNRAAGNMLYRQQRFKDAIEPFERASVLAENEFHSVVMLTSCYTAAGDEVGLRRTAAIALARAEKRLQANQWDGAALQCGVGALAVLGESERANEWMERALLIHPENMNMRYNFACTLSAQFHDVDGALELLAPILATASARRVRFARIDSDLDYIRDDPRFEQMLAAAEARLGAGPENSP